jgi:biotin carboxylase
MPTDRTRLAVLAGMHASLSPMHTAVAANGLAQVTFLVDAQERARYPELWSVAEALCPTTLVDFADVAQCIQAVRSFGAERALTFVDRLCGLAADLNRALGVATDLVPLWGQKDAQRAALHRAGVSPIPAARVASAADLRRFVAMQDLPVIVKPLDGVSGRDVWPVEESAQLNAAVAALWPDGSPTQPMLAERFVVGDTRAEPHLADYVSAEIFRCGGRTAAAFVTDRLRVMPPCRETGLVLPSSLPADISRDAIRTAEAALDAVGAGDGAFHVELKPRTGGAMVVEVNGRLGGYIARLAAHAAGVDLGAAAITAALGRPPELDLIWRRYALVLLFQPPPQAYRVSSAPSRSAVTELPGVLGVDDIANVGTAVDWRDGSNSAVSTVWLGADSPGELHCRLVDVAGFLTRAFEFVDQDGVRTTDRTWLEALAGQEAST